MANVLRVSHVEGITTADAADRIAERRIAAATPRPGSSERGS